MSAAAGELGFNNSTAATQIPVIYPWRPSDANQIRDGFDIIWGLPEYPPEEKPKRKSKWLLKQMARRGHQR